MASLRKKPNSKFWIACFTKASGRQAQRSTKTTDRRLALRIANEFEREARTHRTSAQARRVISDLHWEITGDDLGFVSVRTYFSDWLSAKAPSVAPSTRNAYGSVIDEFLKFLKTRADGEVVSITPLDVIRFRDETASRLTPASTNNKLKILRIVFQEAWRDGAVDTNVAAKVPNVKVERSAIRRPFTLDEIGRLLEVADEDWKGVIFFGLYAGQRLGDIVRLTWRNIALEDGILTLDSKKTGRRLILPLAPPLLAWLKGREARSQSEGPLFPEFYGIANRSAKVGTLSNRFHDLMARVDLVAKRSHQKKGGKDGRGGKRKQSELSFHCLRHTATSLMKNAGISPAIVQEFVGHASKAVSDNYTHIELEALRRASNALPDVTAQTS